MQQMFQVCCRTTAGNIPLRGQTLDRWWEPNDPSIFLWAQLPAPQNTFDPALPPEAQRHIERVISCLQPKGVVNGRPDFRPMVRPRVKVDRPPIFRESNLNG